MRTYFVTDKTRLTSTETSYLNNLTINSTTPATIEVKNSGDLSKLSEIQFGCASAITATLEGKMDGTNLVQMKTETFTGFKVWSLQYINRYDLKLSISTASGTDIVVPVLVFMDDSFLC